MAHHLVIQLARFGDLLQTKRLLLSLAAEPNSTVHLAVDTSLVPLARLIYPFAEVHGLRAHGSGTHMADVFRENRDVFAILASTPFNSIYNLNFTGMSLAMAGLFDPDIVRGYSRRNGQILRSTWLRMAYRWMTDRRSAPMNLVDLWGHFHPDPIPAAAVNPKAMIGKIGRILVVPAGREARRSLPAEVLAPLVDVVFAARGGPEIVLAGSAAERPFARKLTRLLRPIVAGNVTDTCGTTSLSDLVEIVEGSDLVLTPDTGIMHLAAHLGVAVKAFFLSSAWCFETGPYGEGHTIFQVTRTCAPCVESAQCPFDTTCLVPFSETAVRRLLLDKAPGPWPDNLAYLESRNDAFGCDYAVVHGSVPESSSRESLRALLAEYAAAPLGRAIPAWAAENIFHESDWMLPRPDSLGVVRGE